MTAVPSLQTFILQHHNVLGTSFFALLLLILEKLMEPEFDCPSDRGLGIAYSMTFFGIPTFVLFVLGCKFSEGCCKAPHSCGDLVYTTIQIIYGPLLWFFILLADGRYAECFMRSLSGKDIGSAAKAISQMLGVGITSLMILLSLWLENCCCGISTFYYRKKYERKMLEDIEEALRSKAQTMQKEIIQDYVQMVPVDQFSPEQATWFEKLENIVHREKNMMEEKFQYNLIISEEEKKQAAKRREAKNAKDKAAELVAKQRESELAAAELAREEAAEQAREEAAEQAREEAAEHEREEAAVQARGEAAEHEREEAAEQEREEAAEHKIEAANRCGAEGSNNIPEGQDNNSNGEQMILRRLSISLTPLLVLP
ncbi:uncharacterized protein [Phyllobates terribilis]|uniref:uncharacterized protein n=1 Tax=Phyllobates terribilis TaxID=111132 RepID=UPI003CCB307A